MCGEDGRQRTIRTRKYSPDARVDSRPFHFIASPQPLHCFEYNKNTCQVEKVYNFTQLNSIYIGQNSGGTKTNFNFYDYLHVNSIKTSTVPVHPDIFPVSFTQLFVSVAHCAILQQAMAPPPTSAARSLPTSCHHPKKHYCFKIKFQLWSRFAGSKNVICTVCTMFHFNYIIQHY